MSRALSLIAPTTGYASPNQLVTAQLATNVGFNPNDYVYAYGNNQVGNLGSTIGVGLVSTYIAGTRVNGAVQTGFTPTSVMSGPYSASATYTGTTRTQNTIFQAFTNVSANNASTLKSCVLNNGNIALVFRDSVANDLKIAVFTNAGASVKAATTISTQTSAGVQNLALGISAMTDGGFVVCYTSTSLSYFQRFDSAGTVTASETALSGTLNSAQNYMSIAAGVNGGFGIVGNNSNQQVYGQSYSSSNAYLGQLTLTSSSNGYDNGIVGLSNGNYAIGVNSFSNNISYAIMSASATEVLARQSINNSPNESFNMAAYDGGFIMSNRNTANSNGRLISISNNGTIISTGVANGFSSTLIQVCVGAENNSAYMIVLNNNTGLFNVSRFTSINSSAIALSSQSDISGFSPSNYLYNNFYNALNGSLYFAAFNSSKPAFITINQATYTQNTTTLTNTGFYTPTNGYYFLGIGATTAAAGSSGLIYTNGGIALPSTYPSVSTGYAFDYQSNSYWAQRGTINGRAINLQGAQ
jgi:hypothetical protein